MLVGLCLAACGDAHAPVHLTPEDVARNNRGVALMGTFDYPAAESAFAEVVAARPTWTEARLNLAIATLNRQNEGDDAAALALVEEVLAAEPSNPRARYLNGLLHLYLGEVEVARREFERVVEADPGDAYAAFYLAQCLTQQERGEEALAWYRKALERDPKLRSSYYGAALILRRLGRDAEADEMLARYDRLANDPSARLAEFRYTRMGPKALALAVDLPAPVSQAPPPEGPVFLAPDTLAELDGSADWASLTTVDLQGDGRQDLFATGASLGGSPSAVLLGGPEGAYSPAAEHPLAGVDGVRAALWGDIDNDGLVDVYLCRAGPNQLWRQTRPGAWRDETETSRSAGSGGVCANGAIFDADHDGDLDLAFVDADGPGELLINNLDGSFRSLGAKLSLSGPARALVAADLDGDRDVDLIAIQRVPPHRVLLNERAWHYRPAPGMDAFRAADIRAAVAGDVDSDGQVEIYSLDGAGALARWQPGADGEWSADVLTRGGDTDEGADGASGLALSDFDGDGRLDLLLRRGTGLRILQLPENGPPALLFEARASAGPAIAVLDQPGRGPALVQIERSAGGAQLRRLAPGPGRYGFAAVALTGRESEADAIRSNASGIGARLAVRSGSRWTVLDSFDPDSGAGQSLQPLAIGLGSAGRADFVSIDWSNGVLQTELDLEAGKTYRIAETQRQLASCPVLFAWDGKRFAFVSDLLGVGGLGFFASPGEVVPPRPWEILPLPEGLLQARNGVYPLRLAEPMEETAYLDHARLHAIDLPPGWSLGVDERMGVGAPEPTGAPLFYRRARAPLAARDGRGNDVTDAILRRDLRAAPPGPLDRRFLGRLAAPQSLTLDFGAPLDAEAAGRLPVLLVDGWLEYAYSQTVFGAWQAGARYRAPSLEAFGGDGRWHAVYPEFGYPAGMPRPMALPLHGLPEGTTRLRLVTNMEVYWDRIRIVYAEAPPGEVVSRSLEVSLARVVKAGFARRTTGPQRVPHYDYDRRSPFWDTKFMAGYYTRLGPVTPLVSGLDGAFAIIGSGEEIQLEFPALPDPPPPGWRRSFLLEVRGYAKDMDLYTQHGETVAPLPVRSDAALDAGDATRRAALHRRYNTRFQAGR